MIAARPNKASAPAAPALPLDDLVRHECLFSAPPASPAAVGEAQRWAATKQLPKAFKFLACP